jgi:hypothetical protein
VLTRVVAVFLSEAPPGVADGLPQDLDGPRIGEFPKSFSCLELSMVFRTIDLELMYTNFMHLRNDQLGKLVSVGHLFLVAVNQEQGNTFVKH